MKAHGWEQNFLCFLLGLYALARVLQLFAGILPDLLIVILHVVPAAVFAVLHGRRLLGGRDVAIFCLLCIGIAAGFESLSLRTGFPFGNYVFTSLMGPKVAQLPILLALAYLGMGYASWCVAFMIVGPLRSERRYFRFLIIPVLASSMMLAWDASMDPIWAYIDKAWVWKDGGAYFGVPISNFFGWFLTVASIYVSFAVFCKCPIDTLIDGAFLRLAATFYAISAIGNLFIRGPWPSVPIILDASGRPWQVASILWASRLVSIAVMLPFAILGFASSIQRQTHEL